MLPSLGIESGAAGHAWRVDDEQPRQLQMQLRLLQQRGRALAQRIARHVRGANLLRDAARLALLHAGTPDVVQQLGFA